MFKKTALILLISIISSFTVYADEVETPSILTDPENGPYVWVSAETGIETIDGEKVWRDLSGNGNHMKVYGDPQVKERAVNQRNAMEMTEASGQFFAVDFDEKYVGPSTIFIVANMKKYSQYKGLFSTSTPNNKKVLNTFEAYFLNNKIEASSWNASGNDISKGSLFEKGDGDIFGKYHTFVVSVWEDKNNSTWRETHLRTHYGVYDKKSGETTLVRSFEAPKRNQLPTLGLYNTFVGFSLGGRNNFDAGEQKGETPESEYAEAIMFKRALTEAEIQTVSEYLSEKYFKPLPPVDGIEFNMSAEKEIEGDEAAVSVTMERVDGSVFNDDYYVIAQLYADKELTEPRDIIVKKNTDDLIFKYDKSLFARIMAFTAFGAEDEGNIGTNIAHPIEQ